MDSKQQATILSSMIDFIDQSGTERVAEIDRQGKQFLNSRLRCR